MPDEITPVTQETAPVATPPVDPAPTPPAAPPQVEEPTGAWPSNWRDHYAKARNGDDKLVKRLERYASPEAALDALISVQNKISAGELRSNSPFPDKGTPEQQAEWRRQAGIPDSPDKYEIQLGDGLVVGEEDKPLVESFLKASHAANLKPNEVNALLKWYFDDVVEAQQAARFDADEKVREQVDEQLRAEWGQDYRKNKAIIEAFLDSGPPGTKDLLFGARLADGTPLASNLDVLRFLADKGREFNPVVSLVPGDPSTQARAIGDEMANLKALMGNKSSEYWKGPKAESLQARYRELLAAQERMNKRAA